MRRRNYVLAATTADSSVHTTRHTEPSYLTVTHVTHAAFPEYRLRINNKNPNICDFGVKQIR